MTLRTEMRREIMRKIQQLTNKHSSKKVKSKEGEKVGHLEQYMQKRQTELTSKQNTKSIKSIHRPRLGDTSLVDLKNKVVSNPKKPKKKKFKVMKWVKGNYFIAMMCFQVLLKAIIWMNLRNTCH